MALRFEGSWDALARIPAGPGRAAALRHAPSRALIAALSAGAGRDPAFANAIATELLNRQQRAPFFGAFVASATFAVAIVVVDLLDTGTPFTLEGGPHEALMEVLTLAMAGLSLLAFFLWRGHLPRFRRALQRWRRGSF